MWECTCDCGGVKVIRASHLRSGQIQSCGCLAREMTSKRSRLKNPTYVSAHYRIYRERGPASDHSCVDCGRTAEEWSYDGQAEHEMVQTLPFKTGMVQARYSPDPKDYSPRCKSCHGLRDATSNAKDLRGNKFGHLVAVQPIGRSKNRTVIWECSCCCGGEAFVHSADLTRGQTRSCGHLRGRRDGDLHTPTCGCEDKPVMVDEADAVDISEMSDAEFEDFIRGAKR